MVPRGLPSTASSMLRKAEIACLPAFASVAASSAMTDRGCRQGNRVKDSLPAHGTTADPAIRRWANICQVRPQENSTADARGCTRIRLLISVHPRASAVENPLSARKNVCPDRLNRHFCHGAGDRRPALGGKSSRSLNQSDGTLHPRQSPHTVALLVHPIAPRLLRCSLSFSA
jgi:hypothetical protein